MHFNDRLILSAKIDAFINKNRIKKDIFGVICALDSMNLLDQKSKKQILFFRESLLQSILSDLVTFGFLCISIYLSKGDFYWSTVCLSFMVIFILGKFGNHKRKRIFYSKKELVEYLNEN